MRRSIRIRLAGDMRYSARSCRAWTWSTRLPTCRPGRRAPLRRMRPSSRWSSNESSAFRLLDRAATWGVAILFISDLHIDATRPAITEQFIEFLRTEARSADALYILGDLFESWVGDDAADAAQAAAI